MRILGFHNKNVLLAVMLIIMAGMTFQSCSKKSKGFSATEGLNYDDSQSLFYPLSTIYHHSEDSSTVIFDIESKDLLYSRPKGTGPFKAKIEVEFKLIAVDTKAIADSGVFQFEDVLSSNENKYVQNVFKVKNPIGLFDLQLHFKDVQRGFIYHQTIKSDKLSKFSSQNYLLYNKSKKLYYTQSATLPEDSIVVFSDRNREFSDIYVMHYTSEIKLPPAPFSSTEPELPILSESEVSVLKWTDSLVFHGYSGLFLLTADTTLQEGKSFFSVNKGFPRVRKQDQLYQPLRYLTTKAEYDNFTKTKYSKEKVDQFWLEGTGDKTKAKDLISIYYSRVQEANKYFSTYTEGWRTDRGMIHLIFGHPSRITKTDDGEIWVYGEDNSIASLQFRFVKTFSPWSDNVYLLNRDPLFRSHWERMVSSWRSGRIYHY